MSLRTQSLKALELFSPRFGAEGVGLGGLEIEVPDLFFYILGGALNFGQVGALKAFRASKATFNSESGERK